MFFRAVLYEFVGGEDDGDDSDGENYASNCANNAVEEAMEDLVPKIQSLSTDCHKYRLKKDRKEQKETEEAKAILGVPTLGTVRRICGRARRVGGSSSRSTGFQPE